MPAVHRISVALCTFNGEKFLNDQLQSFLQQSRQPDELIVSDDGSTDNTIEILNTFASTAAFSVHVSCNEQQLGPAQNFAKAIAACTGNIISFCDQDDIWEPSKIEQTAAAFERDPLLAFAFSDAMVCDVNCKPLGYRLWTSVGLVEKHQRMFQAGKRVQCAAQAKRCNGRNAFFRGSISPNDFTDPYRVDARWVDCIAAVGGWPGFRARSTTDPLSATRCPVRRRGPEVAVSAVSQRQGDGPQRVQRLG